MVRISLAIAGLLVVPPLFGGFALAMESANNLDANIGFDLSYVSSNGQHSRIDGGDSKLRYAADEVVLNRAFIEAKLGLSDTLAANFAAEAYDDSLGSTVDATQIFLDWRPIPRSSTRYRFRLGLFYPSLSEENIGPGWSSPFSTNFSAINTWIAEEVRTTGVEVSASRRPAALGGAHRFTLTGAAFVGNDPTGSLLAWRGWAIHNRQSRLGDRPPLPALAQIQPGMMFEGQDHHVEPFVELDDRVGYYVGGTWDYRNHSAISLTHYDNRADPAVLKNGQYGWATRFDHLAFRVGLGHKLGFISQWIRGTTQMGSVLAVARAVDTEFDSRALLLTSNWDRHRVSVRYDHFEVLDRDDTPLDENGERGHAWTLSYEYGLSEHLRVSIEGLQVTSWRDVRARLGLEPTVTEKQLQVTVKLRR